MWSPVGEVARVAGQQVTAADEDLVVHHGHVLTHLFQGVDSDCGVGQQRPEVGECGGRQPERHVDATAAGLGQGLSDASVGARGVSGG
jgi:hypothetical protein